MTTLDKLIHPSMLIISMLGSMSVTLAIGPEVKVGDLSPYETESLRSAHRWNALKLPAVVSADPQATWEISPPHEGELMSWRVLLGERVSKGDVLAEVSLYSLGDLKARLRSAQRVSSARSRRVKSIKRQVNSGARAQAALDEAEADYEEANAELGLARSALFARSKNGSSALKWLSPVSGTITHIRCAPGGAIEAHKPCITVSDQGRRVIVVRSPMISLAQLTIGQLAHWTPSLMGSSSESAKAVALKLRAVIPPTKGDGALGEAIFTSDEGHSLPPPGVGGVIEISRSADEHLVWVPRSALVEWAGSYRVFLVENNLTRAVRLEVMGGFEGGVVCRSSELTEGDEVVTRGAFDLKSQALLTEED